MTAAPKFQPDYADSVALNALISMPKVLDEWHLLTALWNALVATFQPSTLRWTFIAIAAATGDMNISHNLLNFQPVAAFEPVKLLPIIHLTR